MLTEQHDAFHMEKEEILRASLKSGQIQTDDVDRAKDGSLQNELFIGCPLLVLMNNLSVAHSTRRIIF